MTTTGVATFNLDIAELVEEAFERCGKEVRSGYDLKTARRSLNLLTVEWANRGINLWTVEEGSIPLVQGTGTYDLPADTIDLLEHVVRTGAATNQSDLTLSRISAPTYAAIPAKNASGRPIQVWVDRQSGATYPSNDIPSVPTVMPPRVHVWPVPDQSNTYTLVYWRLRRIQDAGSGVTTMDIPFRFLNALVAGLAFYLSMKLPGVDINRVTGLKAAYDEQFQLAANEDREKADARFVPRLR